MTVEPIKTPDERAEKECPICSGIVIEPRSSDKGHCAGCARKWDWNDLE